MTIPLRGRRSDVVRKFIYKKSMVAVLTRKTVQAEEYEEPKREKEQLSEEKQINAIWLRQYKVFLWVIK